MDGLTRVEAAWDWVAVDGRAEIIDPDDPLPGVDAPALAVLLRPVTALFAEQ